MQKRSVMILYIHIPFCESKCGYCTFNSYASADYLKDTYVESLLFDIKDTLTQWIDRDFGCDTHKQDTLESIYIGGGTPNELDSSVYGRIFELIFSITPFSKVREITIEANPNLLDSNWCEDLCSFGVSRISIGVQSFFDDKLAFLERMHRYNDIFIALESVKNFKNVSIDLIYDTPLDSISRIKQEIYNISLLPINHISAYSLMLEKGSNLYDKCKNIPKKESLCNVVAENLARIGFSQYEVSSYHKGYKSLHNLSYWQGKEYLGCGAGAFGRIGYVRYHKEKAIEFYIKNPTFIHKENLDSRDLDFEELFLGLRCEIGIPLNKLNQEKVRILLDEKKCILQDYQGKLHIRACNLFLADEIALWLWD